MWKTSNKLAVRLCLYLAYTLRGFYLLPLESKLGEEKDKIIHQGND